MTTPALPTLDRNGEVWTGHFPGLGSIAIAADGSVDVMAEGGPEEDLQTRQRALRYGWAEGLSLVRRGFLLASGAGAVDPETNEVTILTGDPHDVTVAVIDLSRRGWHVLADRFTPVLWRDDRLVAYPREAPLLLALARAEKSGLAGEAARTDSDALIVDLPRATTPAVVTSVVTITRRRPHDEVLSDLTGQKRFEAASQLIIGGALAPLNDSDGGTSAAQGMAQTLKLTSLRFGLLRAQLSAISSDIDVLLQWLAQGRVS